MEDTTKALGSKGEDLAVRFLKKKGFKIIERNFHCPAGEIDLVAREGDTLVFVEIKARSSSDFGLPQDAVDRFKQQKIIQAARTYLAQHRLSEEIPARFDVVAIHLLSTEPSIELIRDAFQEQ
jgi:putative endonuclease